MSLQLTNAALAGERWSTSGTAGTLRSRVLYLRIGLGGALRVQDTTSAAALAVLQPTVTDEVQTNSGRCVRASYTSQNAQAALMELRRLSGLTWTQLACLFDSTRRSLHFWASGKPLSQAHATQLHRLLALLRRLDRGSAHANRTLLLSVQPDGSIPFELLVKGQYEEVLAQLGPGTSPIRPYPTPLAITAQIARAPYAPEDLAGALQERVHKEEGKTRVPRLARKRV
ncbi:MAG: XRE family transcriptional regulator [Candidatus Tectomicrobia bacterium]|uniref:XRE family transcriptional regulator n=1 Tax=Tectimicrobiota bacterium TaxID=2528274 RepID=A0A938B2U7_UNCTE|nr:XRE family transcriptional regulator [Candidatus Tectomicrobia bacterium]